jgi:dTDP-4-amino-4,6-dideoxygalactose transaminase
LGLRQPHSFEEALASFLEVPAVQLEASGSACLVIALECLKRLSRRREIIVPAFTCPLVAIAAAQAGVKVKLCDLERNSMELDVNHLSNLCDENTLAVIATHLGGFPANLEPIMRIASERNAFVIEDSAQSLGARWHGKRVGTMADIGFFSLAFGKGLTLGEGGILVAREQDMFARLRETSQSIVRSNPLEDLIRSLSLVGYWLLYRPELLSLIYGNHLRSKLAEGKLIEAVGDRFELSIPVTKVGQWRKLVGNSALTRLDSFILSNAERGRCRAAELNEIEGVQALLETPGTTGTWPFIMVLFEREEVRDAVLSQLWCQGSGVTRLFIHELSGYDYLRGVVPALNMPNAQSFASRMLTISNSHWMTDYDFAAVKNVIVGAHCMRPLAGRLLR